MALENSIETVLSHENDTTLADIDKRLEEVQTELLKPANSKAEYDKVGDEIYLAKGTVLVVLVPIHGYAFRIIPLLIPVKRDNCLVDSPSSFKTFKYLSLLSTSIH